MMSGSWILVCSRYLVSATPPTFWIDPFETLQVFLMVPGRFGPESFWPNFSMVGYISMG